MHAKTCALNNQMKWVHNTVCYRSLDSMSSTRYDVKEGINVTCSRGSNLFSYDILMSKQCTGKIGK